MKTHTKIVLIGGFITGLSVILRISLTMLRTFFAGRFLSPEIIGVFAIAFAIYTFLAHISTFGLGVIANRYIARHRNNISETKRTVQTVLVVPLVISIVTSLIAFVISPILAQIFEMQEFTVVFRIIVLSLPAYVMLLTIASLGISFESVKIRSFSHDFIYSLGFLVFLVLLTFSPIVQYALPLSLLLSVVLALFSALWIATKEGLSKWFVGIKKAPIKFDLLRMSWPVMLNKLLLQFSAWFDTILIGLFLTASSTGVYNIALQVTKLPQIGLFAIVPIILPVLSKLFASNQKNDAKETYQNVVKYLFILVGPVLVFVALFSSVILNMFGEEYVVSNKIILVLLMGTIAHVFSGPIDMVLIALDRQREVFMNSVIAFVIALIVGTIIIPELGLFGAAIANALAAIIQNGLGLVRLWIAERVHPYTKENIIQFLGLVVIATIIFVLDINIAGPVTSQLLVLFGIGLITECMYLLFLVVTGVVKKNDILRLGLFAKSVIKNKSLPR